MNNLRPSKSNEVYTYKKLAMAESSVDNHIVISNLKPNTAYGIVVQAYNRQGTGPSLNEIIGQTLEYGKVTSLCDVIVFLTFLFNFSFLLTIFLFFLNRSAVFCDTKSI